MFSYQFINHPSAFTLDESRISRIFDMVQLVPITQNWILNIAFLSDDEMRVLNRDYRGIDKTTDVLSFHYYDAFSELWTDDVGGEIILSESRILAQALEHQHSPQKETEILVLHSILHIMWYDHETDEDYTRMWKWESELRAKL